MLTKTNFVLTLFLFNLCLLFVACEKEEASEIATIPVPSIYAHMEGTFYTQRIRRSNYGYGSVYFSYQDTADLNIKISAKNDTLRIFNYVFPINTVNQTSFSESSGSIYNPEELKLDYYNNYDSIVLSYEVFSTTAGANPSSKVIYSGVRNSTNGQRTAGVFTLKVIHKEFAAQIDTQYTADLMVNVIKIEPSYSDYHSVKFEIGATELGCNSFYTYSNEHKTGNSGAYEKVVYMGNDSLYIDYYVTDEGIYPPYTIDTIYYSYQGVKK